MKIQNLTIGISLYSSDFNDSNGTKPVEEKVAAAGRTLQAVASAFRAAGYEVNQLKIALNNFESWLAVEDVNQMSEALRLLHSCLAKSMIDSCSLGNCSEATSLVIVPTILSISRLFTCSFTVFPVGGSSPPEYDRCKALAAAILDVGSSGEGANARSFSFCGAFNVPPDSPFGPVSFHEVNTPASLSIALEAADLLFLAFYAAESVAEAASNLRTTVRQAVSPLHDLAAATCKDLSVEYKGIDLSIVPGNTPQDSVGSGIEYLRPNHFGADGTLSSLAVVASALEDVAKDSNIKTCGFCGVHLPVLRDVRLAQRAAESPPSFSMRDLLGFVAVSGIGPDLVPITADVSVDALSNLLLDLGSLSFNTKKPMMCRCIPIQNSKPSDKTTFGTAVYSPSSLSDTSIFSL